ncbi:MAG TPA: DNA repair exonuclease [Desulfitobacterium dehalogenans]|uniref:DNA repair exonuclease n=1 Tax=Desulfitobacterium dehalogenans TaxID=36854 RepID=A0A7C7D639_9FIRM|nr:DNA repair exonuclease [Desulfitobacterium dehalogenans]
MPVSFIIAGDLHFRSEPPRNRKDNYEKAILTKLYEVFQIAHDHGVKAIIIPGDIFDSSNVSLSTIAKLGEFLQVCTQEFGAEVLTISGNHDIPAGNKNALPRTPYGLLERLSFFLNIEENTYGDDWLDEIEISGCGFDYQTDTDSGKEQFMAANLSGESLKIHVVHSMLLAASPSFPMHHTLIDDVETNADIIISGHYHDGFGIIRRKDGKLFINPGALCRLSASQAEMNRRVQVALLTVNSKTDFHAELIPLKSSRPAEEVLDREAIVEKKEHENWLESFFDSLQQEGEEKFLEVREIVEKIASLENVSDGVKLEALKRIGEAREKLGRGVM